MGTVVQDFQTTIARRAELAGFGVHGGKPACLVFHPADVDTGIIFQITRNGAVALEMRASVTEIGATDLCTVLGDPSGLHVGTVEHVMAALSGLGIDNVIIEVDGAEVPILDGSAAGFVDAIEQAGIRVQGVRRRYIRVLKPVRLESGASWAEFRPFDGSRFEVEIDFESPAIGRQSYATNLSPASFRRDLARARTFGFMKDVERLWAGGFALGSSLENTVVIGDDSRVINMEGLRFPDEFVRHKMLDAIGDLALAGARIIGAFRSYRGGHRLNAAALRHLLSDSTAFEIVETNRRERGRQAEMIAVGAAAHAPSVL